MKISAHRAFQAFGLLAAGLVVSTYLVAAEPPAAPKVSSFAPAEDLLRQVDYFIGRIDDSLASKEEYTEAKQSRVKKDANTLIVIAQALALHDQDNKLKKAAPSMIAPAKALADGSADFDAASKAAADLKKAIAGEASGQAEVKEWEKIASLGQLMKQVPLLNNTLKRGLDKRRFEKQAEESAGLAASLAVIAQAASVDTHEVKDPENTKFWYQYSAQMRDSAGQVNAATRAGNLAEASAAMKVMAKSCDDCHADFRSE